MRPYALLTKLMQLWNNIVLYIARRPTQVAGVWLLLLAVLPSFWRAAEDNPFPVLRDVAYCPFCSIVAESISRLEARQFLWAPVIDKNVPNNLLADSVCSDDGVHWGRSWWVGAQRLVPGTNSTFVWRTTISGRAMYEANFTNWMTDEPNFYQNAESCVHMAGVINYKWNDLWCEYNSCHLCEIDLV